MFDDGSPQDPDAQSGQGASGEPEEAAHPPVRAADAGRPDAGHPAKSLEDPRPAHADPVDDRPDTLHPDDDAWPPEGAWFPTTECPPLVDPDPFAAEARPVRETDWHPFELDPPAEDTCPVTLLRSLGDDRAVAEILTAPPSAGTAWALQGVEVHDLDDFAAVECAAAWRRLSSWAAAEAARCAAAVADRPSMNPEWPPSAGRVSEPCTAGTELALRLGVSRRAGTDLVRLGQAMEGPLWPTGEALQRGDLDERKAHILVRALAESPAQVAAVVQDAVLPHAARRTPAQLTADVERALVEADPEGADRRHVRARRSRHVGRPRVLPDGMAGMWAVLPSSTAVALDRTLDAVARHARSDGDVRTLSQLRADALTAAVLGDEELRRRLRARAECEPAGRGSSPALSSTPSAECGDGTRSASLEAATDLDDVPGLVPLVHDLDRLLSERVRVDVRVVVPADALLGEGEVAAHLSGVGAIPPLAARALAAGGIWRRLVTDPLSGAVLDVGRTRYRPTAEIVEHLRERDGTCVRPGCSTPAEQCDLDHRVPWEQLGTTSVENMSPLCRADHLLKTHAGHRLAREPDGSVVWRTPTGQQHRRPPHRPGAPSVRRLPDSHDDDIPF